MASPRLSESRVLNGVVLDISLANLWGYFVCPIVADDAHAEGVIDALSAILLTRHPGSVRAAADIITRERRNMTIDKRDFHMSSFVGSPEPSYALIGQRVGVHLNSDGKLVALWYR